MSSRAAVATAARGLQREPSHTFRLTVQPTAADTFGVTIVEGCGPRTGPTTPVLSASPAQTARVLDAVIAALKASGHTAGRLSVERGTPISMEEAAGVRLALTLFASQPVTRHDRIRALVAGIRAMSVEETYYWYAKCVGQEAPRARKALRVLLADHKTDN